MIALGNHLFIRISPRPLGLLCRDPSLKLLLPLRTRRSAKGALGKDLSRLLASVRFSLIYILDLFLGQWFNIVVFAGVGDFAPGVSGRDDVSTGVQTQPQPSIHHAVVTRHLVSLAGGFSMTSLKLSTVGVEVGSQCSRLLMMVIIKFEWGISSLFLIGSRFHLIFAFKINSSPNPAATVVHATGHQIACFFFARSVRWKRLSCWIL